MTKIIRAKHDVSNPFTQINNSLIRDPSVKGVAFKILIIMLSSNDKFNFNITYLAEHCGCARNTAAAAVNSLIAKGHVTRVQNRDKGGRFKGFDYQVFESPYLKKRDLEKCDNKKNTSSSKKIRRTTTRSAHVVVSSSHEDKEIVALYEARLQELEPPPSKPAAPPGYFPELDAIPQLTVAQKVQLSREIKHPEELPRRIKAYKQYEAKHVIRSPIGVLKDAFGLNGKPAWEPNPDKPKSVRDYLTDRIKSGQTLGDLACYHDHTGIVFEPVLAGKGLQSFGWKWSELQSVEQIRHELRRRNL
jgi:predicted transcriptional regulator